MSKYDPDRHVHSIHNKKLDLFLDSPTQKMSNMWINIVSLSHQASYCMPYMNNAFDVRHDYFEYAYVRIKLTIIAMSHLSHLPNFLCKLFEVYFYIH